ncbi:ArnT family glycosyltransferase, partial [Streptomyces sp. NPDC059552]|uniref:ArnT family glycosyltransferase n=1 Tax=Streptomyces sp. NPDC059552 TaxID=3346862 RepID=UPI0036B5D76A
MTATLPTATDPQPGTRTAPAPRTPAATGRPGSHPPAPARPLVRFRSSRPDLLLCGALLLVIVLVQGWNITDFPTLSDDEGTYLAQAWAVQQGDGLAHYTYWYDHPPLGWIQLAGLTYLPSLFVPESMTVASMRCAMLAVSAASAVLLYVLARRLWLPRWAAGLAMALFGLSPLSVVLQREIFLDNLAVMWMLLAFCLAASPSRHLWHHFGSGLAAATAVLTKETMLVVLPALLVTMWRHSHRDTRKFAVTGAITACVLIGLSYPLYALLNGELLPGAGHVSLIDGITYQMGREGSGFILTPGSGSNGVLRSWLYYDTVLPLGGLAGAVLLLATVLRSVTARALAGPALAAVILAVVALRPSGYLPAMYVIQALPFLALVLAGGAAGITHAVLRPARGAPPPARRRGGRGGGGGARRRGAAGWVG